MIRLPAWLACGCVVLLLTVAGTGSAQAHAFAQPYVLPMPYWLYIYGCLAALLLSFLLLGFFSTDKATKTVPKTLAFGEHVGLQWLRRLHIKTLLQGLSVAMLVLSIASGFLGSHDVYRNFNMTAFWLIFGLAGTYLAAVLGNWYVALNPWLCITAMLARLWPSFGQGRCAYPARLSYWPALLFYILFISLELLGNIRPFSLSVILLSYSLINLVGVGLVGQRDWFKYAELFSVFMRLVSSLAVIDYQPSLSGAKRWSLRWPFSGVLGLRIGDSSLLLFILFMLSSTAFDGLRDTQLWFKLFWYDPAGLLQQLIGQHPLYIYPTLRPWFVAYEWLWLLLSPLLYWAVFALFLWLGRLLTGDPTPTRQLLRNYGATLLSIAVVYHATHYYTLLLTQGVKIRALVSDPFGWNWDLFGTALSMRIPIIPDLGKVWYSQVALILLGHVIAVWAAHRVALQHYGSRRQAMLSQLPMLLLMLLFTAAGLWILAQPLQGRT